MKTLRRMGGMLCLFAAIVLCTQCSSKHADKQRVVVAQWGQEKYLIYLPLYVALENKYFQDCGLDVQIKYSGNDDQVFASVLQGSAHCGIGDPVFTAIANEKGGDVGRVIASIVDGVAIWGVTNKPEIKVITSPDELVGLKIATFPAPSTNYTLMNSTLVRLGDKADATTIVQAPIGGQIALLESGSADIAMVLEPAASLAEARGYRVVFSSPGFFGPFAFTGLTVSSTFLHENAEIVQGLVSSIQRALTFCHDNEAGAVAIAERLFPSLDKSVVRNAVRRMLSEGTIPKSALVSEQAWSAATQVRAAVGDLKNPSCYDSAVDVTFAQKSVQ